MEEIKLDIIGIFCNHPSLPSKHYILILEDSIGKRRLPIVVDPSEAKSIACMQGNKKADPTQPFMHDILKNVFVGLGYKVQKVTITAVKDDLYFSTIFISDGDHIFSLDTRSVDAIALGLGFGAPVFAYASVLNDLDNINMMVHKKMAQGNEMFANNNSDKTFPLQLDNILIQNIEIYTVPILQDLLHRLIEREDYKQAARIRDELKRRGIAGF